ncbi:cytochrome P450 [Xylaria nigripes]|nr:cytochrome P450 [Xylaria nigripes]
MPSNSDSTHYLSLLAFCALCPLAWYVIQRKRHDFRIRKIGGVRARSIGTNPISGARQVTALFLAHMRDELHEYISQIFDYASPECPNCVEIQITPRERFIFTQDPEHVKTVLTTKFSDFGKGPSFYRLWHPFLGDSIFTTDKTQWHDYRNLLRPMFLKDRISDLTTFETWTTAFMKKLPQSGQTVDIMDLLYRMTLDIATEFLLGASSDSLENPRSEFARAFNNVQRIQTMITITGPFHTLIPRWNYNREIKIVDQFMMPYIEKALALSQEELHKYTKSDKNFTFLHSIIHYTRDPIVLRDQIVSTLLASRDTTAATLSWAFYELARYPEKYQKLRQEIISFVGRDRTPTYEDLKTMRYLRHTIDETLRLYPAVPNNMRTALIDTTLPGPPGHPPIGVVKGDVVVYSTVAMQRRKDLYPPVSGDFADPSIFSPERWESWSPTPGQYVPFNSGPRICIGQNFAITEMAYFMVKFVQKYERIEYKGDWHAQKYKADIIGTPSQGVCLALFEESLQQSP